MVKRSLLQSLNYEGYSAALTTKTTQDTPSQRSTPIELNALHEDLKYDSPELWYSILCGFILTFMIVGLSCTKLAWLRSKALVDRIDIDSTISIVCAGDLECLGLG